MVLAGIIIFIGGFLLFTTSTSASSASSSSLSSFVVMTARPPSAAALAAATESTSTHRYRWIDEYGNVSHETAEEARRGMMRYLSDNAMPYDDPIARTLGLLDRSPPSPSSSSEGGEGEGTTMSTTGGGIYTSKVDGLSDGIVNRTIYHSLLAKELYPWTDVVPKSIYAEYVVPYAIVNEARTDHRTLLFAALRDVLAGYERSPPRRRDFEYVDVVDGTDDDDAAATGAAWDHPRSSTVTSTTPRMMMMDAVKLINGRLWSMLGRASAGPIIFVPGSTPLIYDPMSIIAYGRSSCTGLAILLVCALRSAGIPSRMAGTPAWHGNVDEGNHSWVEVYVPFDDDDDGGKGKRGSGEGGGDAGGEWIFLEPSPGIKEGEDEENSNSDDLYRDPRSRWFCTPERMDGSTSVYATRYTRGGITTTTTTHYPMAWSDPDADVGVVGVDRTAYYTGICGGSTTSFK
ncbi:hypothetical protein ACHAXA_000606 [Cyclostephanos tholiformis]|uniref:Transglutaminase-like domain-containing protein n=1 Tax=Cyclostephanos tholiformis TaxID=382380 RepID=A0ABD3SQX8_9STRA